MRPAGHSSEPESAESSICLWGSERTQLDAPPVFQDACHDPVRQIESTPPGSAIHHRSAARSNAFKESLKFRPQGFFSLRRKRREIEFRLRAGLHHAHSKRVLAR